MKYHMSLVVCVCVCVFMCVYVSVYNTFPANTNSSIVAILPSFHMMIYTYSSNRAHSFVNMQMSWLSVDASPSPFLLPCLYQRLFLSHLHQNHWSQRICRKQWGGCPPPGEVLRSDRGMFHAESMMLWREAECCFLSMCTIALSFVWPSLAYSMYECVCTRERRERVCVCTCMWRYAHVKDPTLFTIINLTNITKFFHYN